MYNGENHMILDHGCIRYDDPRYDEPKRKPKDFVDISRFMKVLHNPMLQTRKPADSAALG